VHDASVEWTIGRDGAVHAGQPRARGACRRLERHGWPHALHPLLAAAFALKIGFVFLVTLRLLPASADRIPLALASVVLLALPLGYVLGSFAHYSFVAQVVAELFAVGMWWTLAVWDESPDWRPMAIFALGRLRGIPDVAGVGGGRRSPHLSLSFCGAVR